MNAAGGDITLFGTCPSSVDEHGADYLERVRDVARWSDHAGYEGLLVFTDNRLVNPWLVAQNIIQATTRLAPLVTVQPAYMHPFTAAKLVADLAYLYRRRIHVNMVVGGLARDLQVIGDTLAHGERYERAVEYALLMKRLLTSREPVSFDGAYYCVNRLRLGAVLSPELIPRFLFSGASPAGMRAARALSATAIANPQEPELQGPAEHSVPGGVRIGVITRPTSVEAWQVALARFPEDRQPARSADQRDPYWTRPAEHYKTFCPYLVGDHATVGRAIETYIDLGYRTFILDVPAEEQDLEHIAVALDIARRSAGLRV